MFIDRECKLTWDMLMVSCWSYQEIPESEWERWAGYEHARKFWEKRIKRRYTLKLTGAKRREFEGMIHFITSNNHPSNTQQPIQQPYVKRSSKENNVPSKGILEVLGCY